MRNQTISMWLVSTFLLTLLLIPSPSDSATVASTSPQDQATGVAVNSVIDVTFGERMDTDSITLSTFTVSDGFSNIAGNITFKTNAGHTVATFTPTINLSYSTTYTATITTGATDTSGSPLAQDNVWTFTTEAAPDTTPPTVDTTLPTSGASGVGIGSTISVTFSELMDTSTITEATFVVTFGGGDISGSISFATSSGKTVATLTPPSPLAYATTYTGTVTTGVQDLAGNPMAQNQVWIFTTEAAPDTTPPTVISTVPESNTSGVSISAPITATFSETMDQSSFNPNVFILSGGGSTIPCTVNVSGAMATFTPSANLAYNTVYTATVTTLVKDQAGNPMAQNYVWTFTTEATPDTTPPTVISTVPDNNTSGVSISTPITVTFSEAMDAATINSATFTVRSGSTDVPGTVSYSGATATFTPTGNWAYYTSYTATVTTGARDLAGNTLASNYVWNFATGIATETIPPTVTSTSPLNNATGVAVNTSLSVTFSEEMNASSIVPAAFILTGGGSNMPCTVNYSGATATFTPTSNLAINTTYTATVTKSVEDAVGNPMVNNFTWSFTTESGSSSDGGGGGGGGCAVLPPGNIHDQSGMGVILVLLSPFFVLAMRRTLRKE